MNLILRFGYLVYRKWLSLTGAVTLGTRALLFRGDTVLLVRLTYHPGWYLPGGGVSKGETFEASMIRELSEECGVKAIEWKLQGIYLNGGEGRIDHVASYIVSKFEGEPHAADTREIAEAGFFPVSALPKGTRRGHRRRIEEALGLLAPETVW